MIDLRDFTDLGVLRILSAPDSLIFAQKAGQRVPRRIPKMWAGGNLSHTLEGVLLDGSKLL